MLFRHELVYDATPDEVFEMLADPLFREQVSRALGVVSHDVRVERRGDGFTLVNDQVQRTADLPAVARKLTGDTTRAVQREEWPDRTGGTLVLDAPGKPSDVSGTISLAPEGGGTREVVELEITVRVPLVAQRLESLVARRVRESIDGEHEVGRAWLAGDRA